MRFYLILATALLVSLSAQSQQKCGQHLLENALRSSNPELDAFITEQDELARAQGENYSSRAEKIIIPVVFHIIHNNGDENISDAQIFDAIRLMNLDYSASSPDLDDVIPSFQDDIGDAEIEFRLATLDPSGNPTTGIDRIVSTRTYTGDESTKLNPWPRNKYLNIWTADNITINGISGAAAAYSRRPAAAQFNASTDGIISNHIYVGSIGTSSEDSKTLSHEAAHYLNLKHTWGDSNDPGCDGTATNPNDPCFGVNNCNEDDDVNDTPRTVGTDDFSCDLNAPGCISGQISNVQNIMDYASCEAMFTKGQVSRMRSALNSSTAQRNQLWTNSNLDATGVTQLTAAKYYVERPVACRGDFVQFYDASTYDADSWSWELVGPSATLTSNDQNPVFEMRDQGIYTVKLTVTQGSVTQSIEDVDAFVVSDVYGTAMPFKESFDGDNRGWIADNNGSVNTEYVWSLSEAVGFDDTYSFKMHNYGQNSRDIDDLYFTSVDFRPLTSISMSFKIAYARRSSLDADRLTVAVSDDCGESWTTFWTGLASFMNNGKPNTSSDYVPQSSSDWLSVNVPTIPLSWVSENAIFRFSFRAGGGNHLYLDDINIDGVYSDVPFLVYPLDQATQRPNDVLLDWRAVDKSSEYEYQLSKDENFSSLVESGTLAALNSDDSQREDTEFRTEGLENGATYFWRVRAKVSGSMGDWSEVWNFTVAADGVGINDQDELRALSVYPNPTSDRVNISVNSNQEDVMIVIYNLNGQIVQQSYVGHMNASSEVSLSTNELSAGSYILEVSSSNDKWNQLLVINK
jgi:hypothetical protein